MTSTMLERRAKGETITDLQGVETVHGRVLATEFLAEYHKIVEEHDHHWRTVSPFRSDFAEVEAAINEDLIDKAADLAYGVSRWVEDSAMEKQIRDAAVNRAADLADIEDW